MNRLIKPFLPYLVAIATFLVISVAFGYPGVFQNKRLFQHDMVTGQGVGAETKKFQEETGEKSLWTNSLFGGMPTYQISVTYPSTGILGTMNKVAGAFLPGPAGYMFALLFGAFLLFMSLGYRKDLDDTWKTVLLSMLGAIAFAFSTYFVIIMQAGHIWKVYTLSYIPPTFAGIIWAYRGRYWIGGFIAAFYTAMQLFSNHPQMTYYFAFVAIIYIAAELIHAIEAKTISNFSKATAILALAGITAFGANSTNLYHSWEYSKYTLRGPSELSDVGDPSVKTSGIDRDYATNWSYGIGETWSLMIPNVKGGASNYLGNNKDAIAKVTPTYRESVAQQNAYWGDQPSTSGPVYVGAFIMFLFVLGLFIVKGRWKYVLLSATIISILLSWGNNFMWLTNIFLDYFPMYNKFRTVSSILIIAELTIPMLAVMALLEIIKNPNIIKEKKQAFYTSLGLTAGLTLVFIAYPYFFSFLSANELDAITAAMQNPEQRDAYARFIDAMETARVSIFKADAWRSFFFIIAGAGILLLYYAKKIKTVPMLILVCTLVFADLYSLDKRYLSSKDFKPNQKMAAYIGQTPADSQILQDKDLSYRVFNLTTSTFNDGTTSFHHKSIGGYHGAKLRRYQDMIELYISRQNQDVLNMLNTKYFIIPENNTPRVMRNHGAMGNAWFVDTVKFVNSADEEILALNSFNPRETAFADKQFQSNIPQNVINTSADSSAYMKLLTYAPNKLTYEAQVSSNKLAVLSEIYYPHGWHAYINGEEVPIVRVNYILRALAIPAGKHNIELVFDPQSYHTTETAAKISYILMILMLATAVLFEWRKCKSR